MPDHRPAEHQDGEVEITQVPPTLPRKVKHKQKETRIYTESVRDEPKLGQQTCGGRSVREDIEF